uniref:Uncharacterized protein n=1 Tax=Picea glauca TaxID=3330 RepID=A0A101LXH6_PICGL|nr:hypothetical protein ABT39_MTgene6153 [Picea glauca]QHR88790.1 hypothetical protein Q903MT_gene2805 [Picea sitchensis]
MLLIFPSRTQLLPSFCALISCVFPPSISFAFFHSSFLPSPQHSLVAITPLLIYILFLWTLLLSF